MIGKDLPFKILEQLPTPVLVTNVKGVIQYANPAFIHATGRPSEELIGQNPRILGAGKTPRRTYKKLWETILSGKTWKGNIYNRRKNGQIYLESIYISPLKNTRGKITHFIGSWQDITDWKYLENKLRKHSKSFEAVSIQDELTGLCNRRGFFTLMDHQVKISRRQKKNIVLFYFDFDRLKAINDKLGHRNGDRALIEAAKLLVRTFRTSDIVARIGGDEFAVAAVDSGNEGAQVILQRFRDSLARFNAPGLQSLYRIEFSVGMVLIKPSKSVNLESVLEKADRLMYQEKHRKNSPA